MEAAIIESCSGWRVYLTLIRILKKAPWMSSFSPEIVHYGKSFISIFQEFFARIDKIFILGTVLMFFLIS